MLQESMKESNNSNMKFVILNLKSENMSAAAQEISITILMENHSHFQSWKQDEVIINDLEIKVIIICDKNYADKGFLTKH